MPKTISVNNTFRDCKSKVHITGLLGDLGTNKQHCKLSQIQLFLRLWRHRKCHDALLTILRFLLKTQCRRRGWWYHVPHSSYCWICTWTSYSLKWPAIRLFVLTVYPDPHQRNIKLRSTGPVWGEFTGDRWIPRTKGQWRGKSFHFMTPSWYFTHKVPVQARRRVILAILKTI